MKKVLIVEDEEHIAKGIRFNLEEEGFLATVVLNGEDALLELERSPFDVVVLDVMLPGIDGFEVAKTLRRDGNYIPILILTAMGRPEDVVRGFDAGADDYLPKPFELSVFIARIKGLLRRSDWPEPSTPFDKGPLEFANRTFDFKRLEIVHNGSIAKLTLMEAKLLRHLIAREGTPVSRKEILEQVWGLKEETDTRAIDNFIVRLRKHIEDDPAKPKFLRTVRGVGYLFELNA